MKIYLHLETLLIECLSTINKFYLLKYLIFRDVILLSVK